MLYQPLKRKLNGFFKEVYHLLPNQLCDVFWIVTKRFFSVLFSRERGETILLVPGNNLQSLINFCAKSDLPLAFLWCAWMDQDIFLKWTSVYAHSPYTPYDKIEQMDLPRAKNYTIINHYWWYKLEVYLMK